MPETGRQAPAAAAAAGPAPWQLRWRRLRRHRAALLGGAAIVLIVSLAVLAPMITAANPTAIDLAIALKPPGRLGLLGTDQLGRDVVARLIYGARTSLTIGGVAALLAGTIGTLLGLMVGYYRKAVDRIVMAVCDLILSFPSILFALLVVSTLGSGVGNLIIALVVHEVPAYTRLVRSMVLGLRDQDYVTAAQAMGAKDKRILLIHLLPNVAGPLIVQSTFFVARAIILSASLGFIGLGVAPPRPEWGVMLAESRSFLSVAPHLIVAPGIAIVSTSLALNLLGDGLRDALDPRGRQG